MPVLTPDDLMAGARPRGERVVLFDDDHYYMGGVLAELLAAEGHAVTLVTPAARVSAWTVNTMEQHRIQSRLLEAGVTSMHDPRRWRRRAPGGAVSPAPTPSREQRAGLRRAGAGHVAAAGGRARADELRAAGGDGPSVRAIGDALSPGTIAGAVWDGRRYAEELDDPEALDRDRTPFLREVVQLAPEEAMAGA